MIEYRCPTCDQAFSTDDYMKSKFCPTCGKYLQVKRIFKPIVIVDTPESIGIIEILPEDAQVSKLWPVYMKSPIEISVGNRFPSVDEWVRRRKQVYLEYQRNFSPNNLSNLSAVQRNFQSWLVFRNNLSWTTLQRTATNALEHPQKLANLLLNLQNEDIEIASRIRNALQGSDKIDGIGQGIVTALLHTFNNDKYGVWNSRTVDTLKKLHRPTFPSDDLGETYKRVNNTLNTLAKELNTDLTTLDGFMWFVSKKYEFL
jgi:DNA-directed RNA polymerase subunit RPC12/RpoP